MLPIKFLNRSFRGDIAGGTLYVLVILVGLIGFATVLTKGVVPPNKVPAGAAVTIVPPAPDTEKKNLQLYTFGYTTPAPTIAVAPSTTSTPTGPPVSTTPPVVACPYDNFKPAGCGACKDFEAVTCDEAVCENGRPKRPLLLDPSRKYYCTYIKNDDPALYQKKLTDPNCAGSCVAKPVIYLYPTFTTFVDVSVSVPGAIIVSDPLYPEDGWKNVLAQPSGMLTYHGKTYNELFFESDVDKVKAPDNGIIIAKKDLELKLTEATTQLGLNGPEQKEFLDYWLPRLNNLNSPYILFSVIDPVEKERIDNVRISPKPDTFIAFIAYFKPLNDPRTVINQLILPSAPSRIGFTAIEWGGTIDN